MKPEQPRGDASQWGPLPQELADTVARHLKTIAGLRERAAAQDSQLEALQRDLAKREDLVHSLRKEVGSGDSPCKGGDSCRAQPEVTVEFGCEGQFAAFGIPVLLHPMQKN